MTITIICFLRLFRCPMYTNSRGRCRMLDAILHVFCDFEKACVKSTTISVPRVILFYTDINMIFPRLSISRDYFSILYADLYATSFDRTLRFARSRRRYAHISITVILLHNVSITLLLRSLRWLAVEWFVARCVWVCKLENFKPMNERQVQFVVSTPLFTYLQ